jgi:hypothetical protein
MDTHVWPAVVWMPDMLGGPGWLIEAPSRGLTERRFSAMNDHPAQPCPDAWPEVVRIDRGGWISGSSITPDDTEQVAAEQIEEGDLLLLDDGTRAEVTDVSFGYYFFLEGRSQGVAIGWKSGRSSGLAFRHAADILYRLAGQE